MVSHRPMPTYREDKVHSLIYSDGGFKHLVLSFNADAEIVKR